MSTTYLEVLIFVDIALTNYFSFSVNITNLAIISSCLGNAFFEITNSFIPLRTQNTTIWLYEIPFQSSLCTRAKPL